MIDVYGRKINYLRMSVTDLCNLRCMYCMPECGIKKMEHDDILRLEEIEKIAEEFISLGINKIKLTGGEPLVRKGILNLVENIGKISGLRDFAMTTNGTLLKKYARALKDSGLNRINISIDTLNEKKYAYITRGGRIREALDGIEEAKKAGLDPIKINVVLIGGFNEDEIEGFINMTKEGTDVRFIELMPVGEASCWSFEKFVSNQSVLNKIKGLVEIDKTDICSPADYYRLPGAKGRVGLISPITHKFCRFCNRVRITSDGKLKLCLHSDEYTDLKEILRNGGDIKRVIRDSIRRKPGSHHLESGEYISSNMVKIGG